jgi:hypothetical protein
VFGIQAGEERTSNGSHGQTQTEIDFPGWTAESSPMDSIINHGDYNEAGISDGNNKGPGKGEAARVRRD